MIERKDASADIIRGEFPWNVNQNWNRYTFSNMDVALSVRIIKF